MQSAARNRLSPERVRPRPMSVGFGSIFIEVFAGVGPAAKEWRVGQAQMALRAGLIGAYLAAARQRAAAHLLEHFSPGDTSWLRRAAGLERRG